MSTSVFPTLKGKGFDIVRTPIWGNSVEQFVSGKEIRINNGWTYPRYQWDLLFNFLRSDSTNLEFQTLLGFYNTMNGAYDSFLYSDTDDNSVTGQGLGTGNGSKLTFQLVRTFGNYTEPVLAPNTVSAVYVDGSSISNSYWSVSNWGTSTPGLITFAGGHAPTSGKAVTADFTYYFPCRFNDDKVAFNNFMNMLWACQKISFISIK